MTHPMRGFIVTAAIVAVAAVALVALYDDSLLPNDAAQYFSVARHVLDGAGLQTDLVFFEEHHRQSKLPVPETGFAPGYPLLIAAVASLGLDAADAAFVINAACFVLIPLLLYLAVQATSGSQGMALGAVFLWLALLMGWYSGWERLSELPFIACTLLSILILPGTTEGERWRWWLAGIAAAAALALRYAGVSFLLAAELVLAAEVLRRRHRLSLRALSAFSVAPIVVLGAVTVRNLYLVGNPLGGNEQFVATSIPEVLGRLAKAFLHLSGFTRTGFAQLRLPESVFLVAVALTLLLSIRHRSSLRLDSARLARLWMDRRLRIAAIYVVLALGLLLWIDLRSAVTLQARMLLVLVPFGLLLLAGLLAAVQVESGRARVAVGLTGLVLSIALLVGQSRVVAWQHSRPNHYMLVRQALDTAIEGEPALDFLRARISTEHPLLGNEPQMLGAIIQGPVVGLPPPPYSSRRWSSPAVRVIVDDFGVEYVVFMPDLQRVTAERVEFFDRLASGESPEWLLPVLVGEKLQVFRVAPSDRDFSRLSTD